jgi:serine/threonine-protein kinase ATR
MQLSSITKHHNKTLYALLNPYLDQVAPFLVSKISSLPSLLTETCKLLSMAPAEFIRVTAPRTLPPLFASCDAKGIEAVSREVEQKAPALFLGHSHFILAYIFMLPKPAESKAISFVLKILADASQEGPIDLRVVVKVSLVKILAELVIAMGDENETKVPAVSQTKSLLLNFADLPLDSGCRCHEKGRAYHKLDGKRKKRTACRIGQFSESSHAWFDVTYQRHVAGYAGKEERGLQA